MVVEDREPAREVVDHEMNLLSWIEGLVALA
jgi:hypothetical protein